MKNCRALVATLSLVALTTTGCKTVDGQVLGGLVGAVGGTLATQGVDNPWLRAALVIGSTAVGSYIGGEIADRLNEDDQRRLYAAQQEALETGTTTAFQNTQSGVSAKVQVVRNEPPRPAVASVPVLKDRVTVTPPLDLSRGTYRVVSKANVRGGPGTDYLVVGSLNQGDIVEVAGKVQGQNWYLTSINGVGSGYVFGNLLEPAVGATVAAAPDPRAVPGAVTEAPVQVSLPCRVLRSEVSTPNGPISEESTRCLQPDGTWQRVT